MTVYSDAPLDAALACDGARDAVQFLSALGLNTHAPITLRIVNELPAGSGATASGCYIADKQCAYLLSLNRLEQRSTPFDVPIDRVLYRSMATHEIAHAIAAQHFAVAKPRVVAQEYIAYVTMFSTMPSDYRQRLFDKFPGQAFTSEMNINTTIYLFDPVRFGVRAFKHFSQLSNGKAFLERLLAGEDLTGGGDR